MNPEATSLEEVSTVEAEAQEDKAAAESPSSSDE